MPKAQRCGTLRATLRITAMTEPAFDKSANTGLTHLVNATEFSLQGLKMAFMTESAFRQELAALCVVLPSGFWLTESLLLSLALFCACMLVLVVELLNSGIEAAVDRVGMEHHDLSKNAKDFGSAAAMISLIIAGSVWFYILYTAYLRLS